VRTPIQIVYIWPFLIRPRRGYWRNGARFIGSKVECLSEGHVRISSRWTGPPALVCFPASLPRFWIPTESKQAIDIVRAFCDSRIICVSPFRLHFFDMVWLLICSNSRTMRLYPQRSNQPPTPSVTAITPRLLARLEHRAFGLPLGTNSPNRRCPPRPRRGNTARAAEPRLSDVRPEHC